MPFLRSSTLPASTVLAVACAMTLAVVAPSPAQAQLDATPRLVNDALPARALPLAPAADAAHFCPRPTGSWWEDIAVRGCIEVLAGRDHTTPVTDVELTWLDLGSLPAYATVDIDAIAASLAAYEQHLADEAAAAEAAEAAERAARATTRSQPARQRAPRELPGQPYSNATISRVLTECGYHDTTPRSLEEQETHWSRTNACIDERMPGYWDWVMAADRIEPEPYDEEAAAAAHERWLEELRAIEAQRRAEMLERRDRENPIAVAAARDALLRGSSSVTFVAFGDPVDVRAAGDAVLRACIETGRRGSYWASKGSWLGGAGQFDPYEVSVTCEAS
jgi:hypothetical protein